MLGFHTAPVNLGDVMVGESVGRVVESKSKNYNIGDLVTVHQGWQTYIKTKDSDPTIIKVLKAIYQVVFF